MHRLICLQLPKEMLSVGVVQIFIANTCLYNKNDIGYKAISGTCRSACKVMRLVLTTSKQEISLVGIPLNIIQLMTEQHFLYAFFFHSSVALLLLKYILYILIIIISLYSL